MSEAIQLYTVQVSTYGLIDSQLQVFLAAVKKGKVKIASCSYGYCVHCEQARFHRPTLDFLSSRVSVAFRSVEDYQHNALQQRHEIK